MVRSAEISSASELSERYNKINKLNAETTDVIKKSRIRCQQLRDVCERLKISIHHIISSEKEEMV